MRLMFVAFFFEVGVALVLVPWSVYWDRNYFVQELPQLQAIISNGFVRGAVSGLGVVNLAAGVRELLALLGDRAGRQPQAPASAPHEFAPPGVRAAEEQE